LLEQRIEAERGGEGFAARARAGAGMRLGQQAAEVSPSRRFGDQEGEVEATTELVAVIADRDLGADDRTDPHPIAGAGDLHRNADVVAVRQPERRAVLTPWSTNG
jgi:hypothetical protein